MKCSPLSNFRRVLGTLSTPAQKAGSRAGAVSRRGHGFPGFLFILGRGHPAGRPLCLRPGKPPATAFLPPSPADNCRLWLVMQSTEAGCKWDNPTCLFTQPGDKGRKLFHINCPFFWHLEVSLLSFSLWRVVTSEFLKYFHDLFLAAFFLLLLEKRA